MSMAFMAKLNELQAQMERQAEQIRALEDEVKALEGLMMAPAHTFEVEAKRKPGRPPKHG